jgi:hypothetical protein
MQLVSTGFLCLLAAAVMTLFINQEIVSGSAGNPYYYSVGY